MSFIDELTRRVSAAVQQNLDQAIRKAIEDYVVGRDEKASRATDGSAGKRRRANSVKQGSRTTGPAREKRNKLIVEAVSRIGEVTVEDVAAATGLDRRGVGSSLYYLSRAGNLKRTECGTYTV